MKYFTSVCALALVVGACGSGGSNPFSAVDSSTPTTGTPTTTSTVPTSVSNDLTSFTFDGSTLTVTGPGFDGDGPELTYTRKAGLDVPGYVAFAAQDDALDDHFTAYAQTIGSATAVLTTSGGSLGYFEGGASYTRTGSYEKPTGDDIPTAGLVRYAGNYVGLSNVDGPGGDLITPPVGIPDEVLPGQAGLVTGNIIINVGFDDNELKGLIYQREITTAGGVLDMPDIILVPTSIDDNGTFSGEAQVGTQTAGAYGGIFAGDNSEGMAGGVHLSDHFLDGTTAEEEYGIFVLGQCNSAVETDTELCAVDD
ncbi:thymidylate synthase [Pseudosulfitobacter sp. SM2401]|uniref:thymidylate synthase n=1 Tax=Pseudosulfitobacter sp. SM2401 TaxID=3350098 RepID=UPI0036F24277